MIANFLETIAKSSKSELLDLANYTSTNWIEDGEDILHFYALCEKVILFSETVQNTLKEYARTEIDKYKEKSVLGVVIKPHNATRYIFDNSTAWISANKQVNQEKERLKEIETIAKKISTKVERVDENGELLFIYPAVKSVTDSIKCQIM